MKTILLRTLFLGMCFLMAGCSGCGDDEQPPEQTPPPATAPVAPVDTTTAPAGTDPANDPAGAPAGAPNTGGGSDGGAPSPNTGTDPASPSASGGGDLASHFRGTTALTQHQSVGTTMALLRRVRTGRHDGFDRVVFEFANEVQGYFIDYIDAPATACGSGDAVEVTGNALLQVRMAQTQAHTEAGAPTVRYREQRPNYATLKEAEQTCDFEGEVTWVLGLAAARPYRAFRLNNPPRLVVDVRQ